MCSYAVSVLRGEAYDFTAVNTDGVTIYYNRINNNTEAEVTYQTNLTTASYFAENINIPAIVTVNETTLPVTSIGKYAFYKCTSIKSVTIPNSVTTIGNEAFSDCSGLTSITIGKSVTNIGTFAFYNCDNLTSIVIPNSVESIGKSAFWHCGNLTAVTIGKSTTNIEEKAFGNCDKLKELTLRGNTLPTCGESVFFGDKTSENTTLYCKTTLLNACKESDSWKNFKEIKVKPFSITISDAGMATGCFDDDLDFSEVEGVKAYIVSGYSPNEGKALLTSATKIPEGTGFIVKGTKGTYEIPAATTDYTYANMLVGALEDITLSKTTTFKTNYILSTNSKGTVGFYLPGTDYTLSAYKAYLQIPTSAVNSSSEAKTSLGLSFDDEDETTDISAIKELNDVTNGNTTIYNLNGQRKQSLSKGLNIVNGKKIFIK